MNTQQQSPSETISTADVEGAAVYDRQGRKLGKINHLMIDETTGRGRSVVLVIKGFLGHSHTELAWASPTVHNTVLDVTPAADQCELI